MPGTTGQQVLPQQAELQDWLTTEIAQLLGTEPEDI